MKSASNSKYQRQHWENSYGAIPEEWDFVTIGSLFAERKERSSDQSKFPLYSFTIQDGVTPKTERYERRFLLKSEENEFSIVHYRDFVFNPMNLRFGAISYSRIEFPVSVSAYYNIIIAKNGKIDHDYMEAFMRSHPVMNLYDRIAIGSLIEKRRVHLSILDTTYIPLPSLAEQKAIGKTLKEWDRAIDLTEQMVAEKRLRRKGLIQQFLTGKRRLPGFSDKWREYEIGKLFREVNRPVEWDDNEFYDLISVRRRSGGLFHRESLYGRQILTKNLKTAKTGDFLISKMQVLHGATGLVTSEFDGMKVSGSYISLLPHKIEIVSTEFFNCFSQLPSFYHLTFLASFGVHIEKMTFNIKWFMKSKVLMPPTTEEQVAIVNFLKAADHELDLLQAKANALREQKKGLMQQLLTGKKRVKV